MALRALPPLLQLLLLLLLAPPLDAEPAPSPQPFAPLERRAGLTPEAFEREYLRLGKPVIVVGAAAGWAARQWTVPRLAERFPQHGFGRDGGLTVANDPELWHALRRDYSTPAFLQLRGQTPRESEPFLFSAAVSHAHIDTGCLLSYAAQLHGYKRWTFWPPVANLTVRDPDSGAALYSPTPTQGVAHPGDVVFFPPGFYHATEMVHPLAPLFRPTMTPGYLLSMSVYFDHPTAGPDLYFRAVGRKLLALPEYCACGLAWQLQPPADFVQHVAEACMGYGKAAPPRDGCPGDSLFVATDPPCLRMCGVAEPFCPTSGSAGGGCACPDPARSFWNGFMCMPEEHCAGRVLDTLAEQTAEAACEA